MKIILSQRIDFDSDYEDIPFVSYHYPKRYRNQITEGDIFIYYQGDRYKRENRYYFGAGVVGSINQYNEESFIANIEQGYRFRSKVPIYKEEDGFLETIGYESVRKKPTPPWQNSIRKISDAAFNEIISRSNTENKYIHSLEVHSSILSDAQDLSALENLNIEYSSAPIEKRSQLTKSIIDRGGRISKALKNILGSQCQICGFNGFEKKDGSFYIEAHHLEQLSYQSPNSLCSDNIVLLCPNCHREIHYGKSVTVKDEGDMIKIKLSKHESIVRKNTTEYLRDTWEKRNGHGE